MRKIAALLIVFICIVSCAGVQEVKKEIKATPNYSGKWTGQSFIEGQGITDNMDLTLVHEGDKVTGVISDTQGFLSSTQLTDVVLKEKTLTFSFIASTLMGNVNVNSTGTFSEDDKEFALTFTVPELNMGGSGKLVKS
jgi:hypothetical protein